MEHAQFYEELYGKLVALIGNERDWVANLANAAALLWEELPRINWVGFYILKGEELVLGPFQGRPACIRIGMQGCVRRLLCCGRAIVPDVPFPATSPVIPSPARCCGARKGWPALRVLVWIALS